MVALPPREYETAVWQQISRQLEILEASESAPENLDPLTMRRMLIRLAGLAHALIQPHRLDEQGTCATCQHEGPQDEREPCTVLPVAILYLFEPLPVIWWHIYTHQGRSPTLDEVRNWLSTNDDT